MKYDAIQLLYGARNCKFKDLNKSELCVMLDMELKMFNIF